MSNGPSISSGNQPDFICGSNGEITTRKAVKYEEHLVHNKHIKTNVDDRHQRISIAAYYRFKKRGPNSRNAVQD